MAIDFGRAAQGIATGYLQAKIRNTEANDALKANTLMRVGETLIGETIPNAIEAEKVRRTNYENLIGDYGVNFANLADLRGFTVDNTSMARLDELLVDNEVNKEKLKDVNFETDYNTRYNTRVKSAEEKYAPILKQLGIDGIGAMGYNTVEAIVKPTAMETVTTKDQITDTVTTQEVPVPTSSTQLKDYLISTPYTFKLPETEFARVAVGYRSFDDAITFEGDNISFKFKGTKDTEYNALRAVTNDVKQKYLDEKGENVNIGMAVEEANQVLYRQTEGQHDVIFNGYSKKDPREVKPGGPEFQANMIEGNGFSNDFNKNFPTDKDKREYFKRYLLQLGTGSEQRYFAQTAPDNVMIGGKSLRDYLLFLSQ